MKVHVFYYSELSARLYLRRNICIASSATILVMGKIFVQFPVLPIDVSRTFACALVVPGTTTNNCYFPRTSFYRNDIYFSRITLCR